MRALAALVLTPLVTVAFLHVATSMMGNPKPLHTPAAEVPPASLVWADRVFTTKAQFSIWLARRDQSYARWVKKHPSASPWEPSAVVVAAPPVTAVVEETEGGSARSTLLAALLALIGVLIVLAVRARDSLFGAVGVVRAHLAAGAGPALSPAGAVVAVRRLDVVQRHSRDRKRAVGEVPGRTFAEFEATVATMLQRPEAEAVEVVEDPVVRLVPAPAPVEIVEPEPLPEPVEVPVVEAAPPAPPPPPKAMPQPAPRAVEPEPAPPVEPVEQPLPEPEPEAVAPPPKPVAPKQPRVARPRARRRAAKPPSPATHVFCEVTYSRGYIKGQFWARLWDVEGNPAVAKSELFPSRSELPQRTAEAEEALDGLARQLVDLGWEPYDEGRSWFGRWFSRPRSSGPPGLLDEG